MWEVYVLILGVVWSSVVGAPDWTDCPSPCSCKWTSGKKSALCRDAGFTTIPNSFDSDMQVLDLNGNSIPYLTKEAFKSVGLINLQRIFLKSAGVRELHPDAFKELTILIEVDLSDNNIATLHQGTFTGNDRLKVLYLNGNPITKLRDAQFPTLPHLKSLEMQHCQIASVHRDAFQHLPVLESLNLNGNRLKQISESVFLPLSKLKSLSLDGNPWKCDCDLRGFRNWLLASNLYSHPLTCTEPSILAEQHWQEIVPQEFACPPIVFVSDTVLQQEQGANVTLKCRVRGDPEPRVTWLFNGQTIGNVSTTQNHDQVLLIEEDNGDVKTEKWTSLSILNVSEVDAGEYACEADNIRGKSVVNITLTLPEVIIAKTLSKSDNWYVWVVRASLCGVIFVVLTVAIACVCRFKSVNSRMKRKGKLIASTSYSEQDKKLLDASITTMIDRQTDSCEGLGSQADMELLEHSLQSIPLEICDQPVHITIENHPDPGVSLFQPPPEFSTSTLPPGAFGNIFISVSVSQDDQTARYPDLIDLPHRKNMSGINDISYFATLPRQHPRIKETEPVIRMGPQYDNMGPRVTAAGNSNLSLTDAMNIEEDIPPPPPPPNCTPLTVEYISL